MIRIGAVFVSGASLGITGAGFASAIAQAAQDVTVDPVRIHVPLNVVIQIGVFLVAVLTAWFALRLALVKANSNSQEALRKADAAHRRIDVVREEISGIRGDVRELKVRVEGVHESVADLKEKLEKQRESLDEQFKQVLDQLYEIGTKGCAKACSQQQR